MEKFKERLLFMILRAFQGLSKTVSVLSMVVVELDQKLYQSVMKVIDELVLYSKCV